jgi:hypothetical protein
MPTTISSAPTFARKSPIRLQEDVEPFVPSAGRALHPSSYDDPEVLPTHAMREIAEGLGRFQHPVAWCADDDPYAPRAVRLLATASYDVWLVTWPACSRLETAGTRGVAHVVSGKLIETSIDVRWCSSDRLRWLNAEETTTLPPTGGHSLANLDTEEATSIHVFSPPLADPTFIGAKTARTGHNQGFPQPSQRHRPADYVRGAQRRKDLTVIHPADRRAGESRLRDA